MAKEKNTVEVSGGITKPGVLDGIKFDPAVERGGRRAGAQNGKGVGRAISGAAYPFEQENYERRSVKLNILVTPSIAEQLDDAAKKGTIKSRNDLINFLLEDYFGKSK